MKVTLPANLAEYRELEKVLDTKALVNQTEWRWFMRAYAKADTYFLLRYVLSTKDIRNEDGSVTVEHPFILDFCREVQFDRHRVLYVGARGHFKSTIKRTDNIRLIMNDPNIAIGLFSVRGKFSQAHTRALMGELQNSKLLIGLFPEILFENKNDYSAWGVESGITVNRSSARQEPTVLASPFLENLPTGSHFDVLEFDDISDMTNSKTPEQVSHSMEQHNAAANLVVTNRRPIFSYTGTYYSYFDLLVRLKEEGKVHRVSVRPAVDASMPAPEGFEHLGGMPVFQTAEQLQEGYERMGPHWYTQQMLCDPRGRAEATLPDNLGKYSGDPAEVAKTCNLYILCDPAAGRTSSRDGTAFMVVGLGQDRNFYVVDLIKKHMDPSERIDTAMKLHKKWNRVSHIVHMRYEETGLSSDVHHLKARMNRDSYRFQVIGVPPAVKLSKQETIKAAWEPLLQEHRIYVPDLASRNRLEWRVEKEPGIVVNMVDDLEHEVSSYPSGEDHFLDCFKILLTEEIRKKRYALKWPESSAPRPLGGDYGNKGDYNNDSGSTTGSRSGSWMVA